MADTNSDSATIASLQTKLQADTKSLQDLQGQLVSAQTDLNTAQTDLTNLNAQYSWPIQAFHILHNAGKWGLKNAAGQYWSVDGSGNIYVSGTSTAQYNTYAQQWKDYSDQAVTINAKIQAAQTVINNLQSSDGTTGAIPTANQHVNDDLTNIANFVPTTTQGQADHAQAVQAAVQIASSNATTAGANATTSQSNAKIADDTVKAGFTTGEIVGYVVGGLVIISLIIFAIIKLKKKKA